jgi:hypothetical protein
LSEVELLRHFSRSNWLKDMISVSNELFTAFGYPCCVDAATKTKGKPSTKGGKIVKDLRNGWGTNSQFPLAEAFFKAVVPGSAFDVGGNGQAYPHVPIPTSSSPAAAARCPRLTHGAQRHSFWRPLGVQRMMMKTALAM